MGREQGNPFLFLRAEHAAESDVMRGRRRREKRPEKKRKKGKKMEVLVVWTRKPSGPRANYVRHLLPVTAMC